MPAFEDSLPDYIDKKAFMADSLPLRCAKIEHGVLDTFRTPLITRIEAVVDAAIASGATQEVALMSWLHQHLTAAHSLLAGAETFHVSEAGKAVLAEIGAFK